MTTDLFIVTYARDFQYLEWCLRSIEKFATGFRQVWIVIPTADLNLLSEVIASFGRNNFIPVLFKEWPNKGMVHHMNIIIHADAYTNSDFICHIDSDCIFTAPVTPETFIRNGKPILQYERFESIGTRHPGVLEWQKAAQNCLPFPIHYETMRQHGETYSRETYAEARRLIEQKTGKPVDEYIRSGRNEYPQEFCEFVTLGNVAIHCFHDRYHLVDNARKPNPDKGDFPIGQFWSHGPIDKPQDIWWEGRQQSIVPIDMIRKVLK